MLATNDGMVYARNCDFGIRLEIQIHSFKQGFVGISYSGLIQFLDWFW